MAPKTTRSHLIKARLQKATRIRNKYPSPLKNKKGIYFLF